MADPKLYLDHPGDWHWFHGYRPAPVVGPCPHHGCEHIAQSVIAWGPDETRYELVQCDAVCQGSCRAWTDGTMHATSPWQHVALAERERVR